MKKQEAESGLSTLKKNNFIEPEDLDKVEIMIQNFKKALQNPSIKSQT